MTPSLKISQKVIDRLSQQSTPSFALLYGVLTKDTLIVLDFQLDDSGGYKPDKSLINSLPAEIYLCGTVNLGGDLDHSQITRGLSEVYVTDNPVYIDYDIETHEFVAHFYVSDQLESTIYTAISIQEVLGQFLYTRLTARVPLICDMSVGCVEDAFTDLRKSIASGVMTFALNKSNVYLIGGDSENGVVGVAGSLTVGELCDESSDGEGGRKKKLQVHGVDVVGVTMLKNMATGGKEHAPLCILDKKRCQTLNIHLPIDTLAIVNRQLPIANLYEILVESAVRSLRLLEAAIFARWNGPTPISQPEVFHFYPEPCGHFLSKIYLKDDPDDDLLHVREELHERLCLGRDMPLFKRANRFVFRTKTQSGEPLVNPHVGVKPTDNGGKIALVKGNYLYYHYCQNKMDDNGWGCAYRSLQTLASWFRCQGYTDKEVPTFQEIQKCLVDIGDKPGSFVGSRQWIGSTEVNYVLNSLLEVTSKILYVSSGEEMAAKGPELVNHFVNHGSPVMIGGGVLAHTILGVDYNSQSGNLKFLILDPHYTGGEDLHVIQSKGWCGWKGVEFWDKTAYYNMCLPQVPRNYY